MKDNFELIALENTKVSHKEKIKYKDKQGYLYSLSRQNISTINRRNTVPAIFFNLNPYTKENIINYLKINNINIELITTDFKNIRAISKLIFNCPKHGEFQKSWNEIKNGQYCPVCGRILNCEHRKNDINDIKKAFEKEGLILLTKDYKNNLQKLRFICPKHKNEGIQEKSWGDFISATSCKCKYCAREKQTADSTKSNEEFKNQVCKIYGNKFTILNTYTGTKNKIKLHCNDCNTTFYQAPNHLLEGHIGCNCKEKSLGESIIKQCCDTYNFSYLQQYKFDNCRNIKPLPFDFAIFDNDNYSKLKGVIEFQGKQHYEYTGGFGNKSKEEAIKKFKEQQKRDKIKKNYCKNNNIFLLEIPYWEIRNIEHLLLTNF